jgi:hypothetical protein
VKKKRKKRYKKLWRNTIPLIDYRGNLEISYEMILKRQEIRVEEEVLFNNFGFSYVRKEEEPVVKGLNKLCYSEPRERRFESMDCECEAQTINHQSNVVMTRPATETEVSNINSYDRQRRYDESTQISIDGNICLTLETDPKVLIDEAHHDNVFGSFVVEDSIQESNVKALMQQRFDLEDGRCDTQAFGNNSAVGVRGLAAETEVSNKNTYDRQKPDNDCTPDSVYLKTCLGSEIDPSESIEAYPKAFITNSESSFNLSPSIHYWNRRVDEKYYQLRSNSYRAVEFTFCAGGCFGSLSLKEFDSGWNTRSFMYFVYSCVVSKDGLRNLEHQFNIGCLFYPKRGVFGVSGSFNCNTNLKSFESNRLKDQIKSNKFTIEHPRELVGQRSPSSFGDG